MKLYLVRHAEALDHIDDARRELSAKGVRQSEALGRFLKNGGVKFDAAYSSPLIRARQTAGLVLDVTNFEEALEYEMAGALVNATRVEDFTAWLKTLPQVRNCLLVGHEPTMSERIQSLLAVSSGYSIEMKKCACCCLESADMEQAVLKFHITPKILGVK
jgi:phosphohistidine phosphatase